MDALHHAMGEGCYPCFTASALHPPNASQWADDPPSWLDLLEIHTVLQLVTKPALLDSISMAHAENWLSEQILGAYIGLGPSFKLNKH